MFRCPSGDLSTEVPLDVGEYAEVLRSGTKLS